MSELMVFIEKNKFSSQSKQALAKLKQLTKYNKFQKRDGGIVYEVFTPDGRLVEKE
jgi:uncharacterized protein YaiL (DUF2058 family)